MLKVRSHKSFVSENTAAIASGVAVL